MNQPVQIDETILQGAFDLHHWIIERLDGMEVSNAERSLVAHSCFDLVIEHHIAITVLIKSRIYGSAFTLVRPTFESFIRDVWIRRCAQDKQITHFINETRDYRLSVILPSVEELYDFKSGIMSRFHDASSGILNSLTHGGFQQVARRSNGPHIEPNYGADEIKDFLKLTGTFALMALEQIATDANRHDVVAEIAGRIGPARDESADNM
jgi:hypothetical protein